jgi:hypothetical protein
MVYSSMMQGLGDSGSGEAFTAGEFGPVLDRTFVKEAAPLGDYIAGALLDAVVGFTVAELEEAGEVAFEAKLEGSVGDRYGEPAPHHTRNLSILLALSPPKESIMVAHSAGGVRDTTGTTWSALIRGFKLALIVEGLRPHTIHNYPWQ